MKQGYISLTEIVKIYGLTKQQNERVRKNAKNWGCEEVKIGRNIYYNVNDVYLIINGLKKIDPHKKHVRTPEYTDLSYCAVMMGKTNHNFYQLATTHGVRTRFVKINGCWKVRTKEAYEIMKKIDTPISIMKSKK